MGDKKGEFNWIKDEVGRPIRFSIGDKIRVINVGDVETFINFLGTYGKTYGTGKFGPSIEGEIIAGGSEYLFALREKNLDQVLFFPWLDKIDYWVKDYPNLGVKYEFIDDDLNESKDLDWIKDIEPTNLDFSFDGKEHWVDVSQIDREGRKKIVNYIKKTVPNYEEFEGDLFGHISRGNYKGIIIHCGSDRTYFEPEENLLCSANSSYEEDYEEDNPHSDILKSIYIDGQEILDYLTVIGDDEELDESLEWSDKDVPFDEKDKSFESDPSWKDDEDWSLNPERSYWKQGDAGGSGSGDMNESEENPLKWIKDVKPDKLSVSPDVFFRDDDDMFYTLDQLGHDTTNMTEMTMAELAINYGYRWSEEHEGWYHRDEVADFKKLNESDELEWISNTRPTLKDVFDENLIGVGDILTLYGTLEGENGLEEQQVDDFKVKIETVSNSEKPRLVSTYFKPLQKKYWGFLGYDGTGDIRFTKKDGNLQLVDRISGKGLVEGSNDWDWVEDIPGTKEFDQTYRYFEIVACYGVDYETEECDDEYSHYVRIPKYEADDIWDGPFNIEGVEMDYLAGPGDEGEGVIMYAIKNRLISHFEINEIIMFEGVRELDKNTYDKLTDYRDIKMVESNDFDWVKDIKPNWGTYYGGIIMKDIEGLPKNLEDVTSEMLLPIWMKIETINRQILTIKNRDAEHGVSETLFESMDQIEWLFGRIMALVDGETASLVSSRMEPQEYYNSRKLSIISHIKGMAQQLELLGESNDFDWVEDIVPEEYKFFEVYVDFGTEGGSYFIKMPNLKFLEYDLDDCCPIDIPVTKEEAEDFLDWAISEKQFEGRDYNYIEHVQQLSREDYCRSFGDYRDDDKNNMNICGKNKETISENNDFDWVKDIKPDRRDSKYYIIDERSSNTLKGGEWFIIEILGRDNHSVKWRSYAWNVEDVFSWRPGWEVKISSPQEFTQLVGMGTSPTYWYPHDGDLNDLPKNHDFGIITQMNESNEFKGLGWISKISSDDYEPNTGDHIEIVNQGEPHLFKNWLSPTIWMDYKMGKITNSNGNIEGVVQKNFPVQNQKDNFVVLIKGTKHEYIFLPKRYKIKQIKEKIRDPEWHGLDITYRPIELRSELKEDSSDTSDWDWAKKIEPKYTKIAPNIYQYGSGSLPRIKVVFKRVEDGEIKTTAIEFDDYEFLDSEEYMNRHFILMGVDDEDNDWLVDGIAYLIGGGEYEWDVNWDSIENNS